MSPKSKLHPAAVVLGLAALAWHPPIHALDPSKAITQYHQDVWTESNGLPQSSVQTITQTRDGYLWVGTRDGLARFDGVTFTVFRAETNEGLHSNDIRALFEDRSGALWIGTFNGGLTRFADGRFSHYPLSDVRQSYGVLEITEDRQGNLWLGTWSGVARFRDGEFTCLTPENGLAGHNGRSLCLDREGRLWIATGHGLNRFFEGQFESYGLKDGLRSQVLRKVYADRDGVIWYGGIGSGLGRFALGDFSHFTTTDGLADNNVRTILQDRDGSHWIGTWKGLSRSHGGRITSFTRHDGLPHDFVEALYEDREGSLWIGTRGGGLARLRDGKFSTFTTKEGLASDSAKCVFEGSDGSLWIGSEGRGLSRQHDGKFSLYNTKNGLISNWVLSIGEDAAGNIWVGTGNPGGLHRFENGTFIACGSFPRDTRVRAVFGDRDGEVWIGTDGSGLYRYRDGAFTLFTTKDGLLSNLVRLIAQDSQGHVWIGTGGGLCRYRDGQFVNFTTADGLAHNAVYSFHEDGDGVLWFGTQSGLSRFKDGKFVSYTTREGLDQDRIFQILEDDQRNLWMSSNRGVFSLAREAVARFDAGRSSRLPCVPYGVADGMETAQCEGGTQPAGWKSRDGRLWFPTASGVVSINPQCIQRNEQPPPVLIEQVSVGGQPLELRHPAKLAPGARELKFHYTALSLIAPDKVRFRYQLEGVDQEWVEAGNRRVAFYNEIPPGTYRFRVKACNNDGIWNETGAAFAFSLAPYFYQTYWFYTLVALAVGLAGWRYHRYRMTQARAQFSLVLAERGRIARELHDTLAQGFAGIGFQLEAVATKLTDAPGQAQQHLNLALNMVRHSLSEARRSVMNLRSAALEKGDLATAIAETARQMMGHKPVEVEVQTVGPVRPLPPKVENNLLRVGQEAITNSLTHGNAGRIQIELHYEPQSIILRVKDDGKGFELPAPPRANGAHFGLLGMQERAKQMGAQLKVKSKPGNGTEVEVHVPVHHAPDFTL